MQATPNHPYKRKRKIIVFTAFDGESLGLMLFDFALITHRSLVHI